MSGPDPAPKSSLQSLEPPPPPIIPPAPTHAPAAHSSSSSSSSSSNANADFARSLADSLTPHPLPVTVTEEADESVEPTSSGSSGKRKALSLAEDDEPEEKEESSASKRRRARIQCMTCGEPNLANRTFCHRSSCGNNLRIAAPDRAPSPAPAVPHAQRALQLAPSPSPIVAMAWPPVADAGTGAGAPPPSTSLAAPVAASTALLPNPYLGPSNSSSQQSFLTQGTHLPLSTEAVEALRKGEFVPIHKYLPLRLDLDSLHQPNRLTLEMDEEGGLRARTGNRTRSVDTVADLFEAHRVGIVEPLTVFHAAGFETGHRLQQYAKLLDTCRVLSQECRYDDKSVIAYYEMYRLKHPKVTDSVGEQDPDIERKFAMQNQANMNRLMASLKVAAASSSASAGKGAVRNHGDASQSRRSGICIKYNNLECTQTPCPRNFEHICCRCFGPHAADTPNACSIADPRKQPGYKPRGNRGGKGPGAGKA